MPCRLVSRHDEAEQETRTLDINRMDGRRSLIGDEAAQVSSRRVAHPSTPLIGARGEAPSRRSVIGARSVAPLVRERSGVWEVSVGGVFVGDYTKREHAEAAALRRIGSSARKASP